MFRAENLSSSRFREEEIQIISLLKSCQLRIGYNIKMKQGVEKKRRKCDKKIMKVKQR